MWRWPGSTLFAQACLSEYINYGILTISTTHPPQIRKLWPPLSQYICLVALLFRTMQTRASYPCRSSSGCVSSYRIDCNIGIFHLVWSYWCRRRCVIRWVQIWVSGVCDGMLDYTGNTWMDYSPGGIWGFWWERLWSPCAANVTWNTNKRTKIGDSVLLSRFIYNNVVCEAAYVP